MVDIAEELGDGVTPLDPCEERAARHRQRALDMAAALEGGATLAEIGRQYGLTRERVRQLINGFSGRRVPEIVAARDARIAAWEAEARAKLEERARAWSEANPGVPAAALAAELGVTEVKALRLLGDRRTLHTREFPRTPVWTDEQLLDALTRFIADTGSTTTKDYDKWHRTDGGPSSQVVILRFGRWSNAIRAAGVETKERREHARKYSDNDLWALLVEWFGTDRPKYTSDAFEKWLDATPGTPSWSLVRRRITDGWVAIRQRALAAAAGDPSLDPEWVADVTTRRDWVKVSADLTPEEAVQHVADAIAELGGALSSAVYEKWASQNRRPCVSKVTAVSGKSWRDLVLAAGGEQRPARPRWTDDQIMAAVAEFAGAGAGSTGEAYRAWSAGGGAPGLETVKRRFGSLRNAIERATRRKAA